MPLSPIWSQASKSFFKPTIAIVFWLPLIMPRKGFFYQLENLYKCMYLSSIRVTSLATDEKGNCEKSKCKTNCFNDQTRGREETSTWWRRRRQTSFFTKTTHFSSGLSSHFNFNERIMTSTTKSKPAHSTSAHKFAGVSCHFLNGLPTIYESFTVCYDQGIEEILLKVENAV